MSDLLILGLGKAYTKINSQSHAVHIYQSLCRIDIHKRRRSSLFIPW